MGTIRRLWRVIQLLRRAGGVAGVKILAKDAPKYLKLLRLLLADGRVPSSAKAVLLGAGAFSVSPLNLPAVIPVIGALDDIGIALFAWDYFMKRVPAEVMRERRVQVGLSPT